MTSGRHIETRVVFLFITGFLPLPVLGADPIETALATLLTVGRDAEHVQKAQQAVETLVSAGPSVLPRILAVIPPQDVVKTNWLRAAYSRIVDQATQQKQPIPTTPLRQFLDNRQAPGFARRLALETLERVQPGAYAMYVESALDDPEFGADAVAAVMERAATVERHDRSAAIGMYQDAYKAAWDFNQCLALAQRLKALNITTDPLSKLGVIREWLVIGPFDDPDEQGYEVVFPPEKRFDPMGSYSGKSGKVSWKAYRSEASDGRVNLLQAVGPYDGAVAYAAVILRSPSEMQLELRGSGDDNLAVWLNGSKVIDHPLYRSHLRMDWHRVKVRFRQGDNLILVKVCQCPAPKEKAPGPPPKWEFLLRLVDDQGQGVSLPVVTHQASEQTKE